MRSTDFGDAHDLTFAMWQLVRKIGSMKLAGLDLEYERWLADRSSR